MLIAEYRVDSPLLMAALERAPDVTVRIEEQYLSADGEIRYLLWVEGDQWPAFEAALADDPTVTDPKLLTEAETRRLIRVVLTDEGEEATTFPRWGEFDIVMLESTATHEGWENRMRVPDRATLAQYRSALREQDLDFQLRSLYRETDADSTAEAQLTADQSTALVTGYEIGYFDVPRRATQADLAERLGISSQAVSERLRRGMATLVRETLV